VASTIRGLPIVGFLGFVAFGFYKFGFLQPNLKSKRFIKNFFIFLVGVSLSLGTFLLDSNLRKKYKVLNNAIIQLYCIYKMPYHSYSTDCQHEYQYLQMQEKSKEVFSNYLSFTLSPEGRKFFGEIIIGYFQYDLDRFVLSKISFLFFLVAFSFVLLEKSRFLPRKFQLNFSTLSFFKFLREHVLLLVSTLSVYLGGFLLFILLAAPGGQRTLTNVKPSLIFGLLLLLVPLQVSGGKGKFKSLFSLPVFVSIIVFSLLYFGNFIFPKKFAREWNERRDKEKIVFKLSDDPIKNYSLWYDNIGYLFYTIRDEHPTWKILHYKAIECPNGQWNNSYQTPCRIEFK
ncbi:MAG: hypothetical protein N3A69_13940, partial [Leptospiraceae bacterium]|nr:hypothetical protein [Leptospiraceae bacterium]